MMSRHLKTLVIDSWVDNDLLYREELGTLVTDNLRISTSREKQAVFRLPVGVP